MNTQTPRNRIRSIAIGLVAAALLVGCMGLERVTIPRSNPAELRESVRPGESVVVRLVSGEEKRFVVKSFESDAILGRRGERVAYDDISTLDVGKRDVEGTVKNGLVLAAFAVGTLALLVIEAELDDDCAESCSAASCEPC